MEKQKCKFCGKEYELCFENFYKNNTYKTGFTRKCRTCENAYQRIRAQTWYRKKRKAICKNYKAELKKEVITALGGECACCGEKRIEFLQVDHINGGGAKHRKLVKGDVYIAIRRENYPVDIYRVLCCNCNFSMGMYGYCPHNNLPNEKNKHRNNPTLKSAL